MNNFNQSSTSNLVNVQSNVPALTCADPYLVVCRSLSTYAATLVASFVTYKEACQFIEDEAKKLGVTSNFGRFFHKGNAYYVVSLKQLLAGKDDYHYDMAVHTVTGNGMIVQSSSNPELNWQYISADDDLLDAFDNTVQYYTGLCESDARFSFKYYSTSTDFVDENLLGSMVLVEIGDIRDGMFELYYNGQPLLNLQKSFGSSVFDVKNRPGEDNFDCLVRTKDYISKL